MVGRSQGGVTAARDHQDEHPRPEGDPTHAFTSHQALRGRRAGFLERYTDRRGVRPVWCCRKFGFLRLLFGLCGLSWLARPAEPATEEERARWRERRRAFRHKVRDAARELLEGDEA